LHLQIHHNPKQNFTFFLVCYDRQTRRQEVSAVGVVLSHLNYRDADCNQAFNFS